jgi:hypothetical protein
MRDELVGHRRSASVTREEGSWRNLGQRGPGDSVGVRIFPSTLPFELRPCSDKLGPVGPAW